MKSKLELVQEYLKLYQLAKDIMKHIEFNTYKNRNMDLKNTDEYQELRKYIKGAAKH